MSARASFGPAACIAMLVLGGCASTPPEEDPVQIKLNDLDTRLQRIERVMANQSLLDIANQLEALRSDVRSMHNDVDQLHNAMDSGRKQQRDLYADLDQRVKNLESRGTAAAAASGATPGSGAAAAPAAPDAAANGEDKASYQAAFNLLKDGQYERAIAAFQKFLAAYPDSSLADNGQYWLGEAYYVNKAYPEAQAAFQRVVDKYPQSRKLGDALLKIGYCRYEMKQWESAREVLGQVVARFTDTPAARLAQQRLDKMSAEKH
ncbi:MAG TPA: tol-pal system protein YbgF [Steroidobacteraceae bacterium]|nr:tol-pal system protein YbgF [Steroidobacteraceae bacterium]